MGVEGYRPEAACRGTCSHRWPDRMRQDDTGQDHLGLAGADLGNRSGRWAAAELPWLVELEAAHWRRDAGRSVVLCKPQDRKSTRLNSSHSQISYAVFCLK